MTPPTPIPGVTFTGEPTGTWYYLSPEQLERGPGQIDSAADVFALGVSIYEALTQRRPFDGSDRLAVTEQILHARPLDPRRLVPSIDRDLAAVVMKALQRDSRNRYPDAGAMSADLAAWLGGTSVGARPLPYGTRLVRWVGRNRVAAGTIVTFAVLSLILAVTLRDLQRRGLELEDARLLTRIRQWATREAAFVTDGKWAEALRLEEIRALVDQLESPLHFDRSSFDPRGILSMAKFPITLSRFIIEQQAAHPEATGEFSVLLTQIGLVGKMIAHDLRRAGLNKILGTTGETNIQGEVVKKLDQIANDTFVRVFEHSGLVCVLASEEMEKPLKMVHEGAKYMLLVDPLDGSSNTDVKMPLGAIFSIRRSKLGQRLPVEDELLQRGTEQIAAGYVLYGASDLFLAAGGGALGLFTSVRSLKHVHRSIAGALSARGLPLYAQHVDGLDTGSLVDFFREDEESCLLGTDALRDGVDVPGRSLRLGVFERVPWPRPDILHKARRAAFGKGYDDQLTRLRLAQGFGRLIRRASDRGVFVLLDARTPSRLLSGLPAGVEVERVGIADAIATVKDFLAAPGLADQRPHGRRQVHTHAERRTAPPRHPRRRRPRLARPARRRPRPVPRHGPPLADQTQPPPHGQRGAPAALYANLVVWKGPPPCDLAKHTDTLVGLADQAGAGTIYIDSLKDAAVGLSDDEVGAGLNRAVQTCLANGVEVIGAHHQRKGQQGGPKPKSIDDVYGSTWITSGSGSVILLWGKAGDVGMELEHLKPPSEPVGPLQVIVNFETGSVSIEDEVDLYDMARKAPYGIQAEAAARALFRCSEPDRNQIEKARRKLKKHPNLEELHGDPSPNGGRSVVYYRPIQHIGGVA